uniref:Uncharacterized protein n=1 Tax=Oncorhynchus kisutch TaxID=8019 RepID=A0A8C7FFU5_ONCKI
YYAHPFVDMLNGEAAAQHLDKDLLELAGGEVVQEGVKHGAEVKEGVGHRVQRHIAAEVGHCPAGLGHGGSHQATHLVGKPADGEGAHY